MVAPDSFLNDAPISQIKNGKANSQDIEGLNNDVNTVQRGAQAGALSDSGIRKSLYRDSTQEAFCQVGPIEVVNQRSLSPTGNSTGRGNHPSMPHNLRKGTSLTFH